MPPEARVRVGIVRPIPGPSRRALRIPDGLDALGGLLEPTLRFRLVPGFLVGQGEEQPVDDFAACLLLDRDRRLQLADGFLVLAGAVQGRAVPAQGFGVRGEAHQRISAPGNDSAGLAHGLVGQGRQVRDVDRCRGCRTCAMPPLQVRAESTIACPVAEFEPQAGENEPVFPALRLDLEQGSTVARRLPPTAQADKHVAAFAITVLVVGREAKILIVVGKRAL